MRFIFLAAGKSKRIFSKIKKNKCLININKKPLIIKLVEEVKKAEIKKISIITGFKSKFLKRKLNKIKNLDFLYNDKYRTTEMLHTLILGIKKYDDDIIISYSDILFDSRIIKKLINKKTKNVTIPILKNWKKIWTIRNKNYLTDGETLILKDKGRIKSIGEKIINLREIKYQYMGLIYIPQKKREYVLNIYDKIKKQKKMHATNFLNYLIKNKLIIDTVKIDSGWYEFDDLEDLNNYKKYFIK
jgi:choline kinase